MPNNENNQIFLDEDHVLRFVINDRLYFDENDNKYKAYDDDSKLWSFIIKNNENKGLSVDHLEGIINNHSNDDLHQAIKLYVIHRFSRSYFQKRSYLKLKIQVLQNLRLSITKTPKDKRPHHCDIWPSEGENNFISNQYEAISRSYEVEINNAIS